MFRDLNIANITSTTMLLPNCLYSCVLLFTFSILDISSSDTPINRPHSRGVSFLMRYCWLDLCIICSSITRLSFCTLVKQLHIPYILGSRRCSVVVPVVLSDGLGFLPRLATMVLSRILGVLLCPAVCATAIPFTLMIFPSCEEFILPTI